MYITITPQKLGTTYAQSSAGFVDYLEKENQGLEAEDMEHFFNQYGDKITAEEVIREIDGNTAKLKKKRTQVLFDYSQPFQIRAAKIGEQQRRSETLYP